MEDNKFYASYSMMDTYKECPQKYKYSYVDRLESKVTKRSLYVGTDIHKLIEQFYVHKDLDLLNERITAHQTFMNTEYMCANPEVDFKKIQDKADELYQDTLSWREYLSLVISKKYNDLGDSMKGELGLNYVEDLARIMAQYEYYYSNDKIKVLDLEHKKYCSLGQYNNKEAILPFICDGIIRLPDTKIYILEHKTYSKDPMTFEQTWLNTQTAIYVSALKAQGWEVQGVLWDNIKSTPPKKPNILKNGSYGKQDSNVTLFSFIDIDTIMDGAGAVAKFIDNLPQEVLDLGVQENYNNFLSRHITVFNEKAVDCILEDSQAVLQEITGTPRIFRNMGWTCNGCEYRELCKAQMLGQDTSLITSTLFNKKD